MSIETPITRSTRQQILLATAGQTIFGPLEFVLFDDDDVEVRIKVPPATTYTLVDTSLYSIEAVDEFPGLFTVEFDAGLAVNTSVWIKGMRVPQRLTNVTQGGTVNSVPLERELDRHAIVMQELRRDVSALFAGNADFESLIASGVGNDSGIPGGTVADALVGLDTRVTANTADIGDLDTRLADVEGAVASYASKASVEAAVIPAASTFLRIAGYYAPGDGGGALYQKTGAEPTHAGKIQSADGAWWVIAELFLNVLMFGVQANGGDDTAGVQATIEAAKLAFSKRVYAPENQYSITRLDLTDIQGFMFEGDGVNATRFNSRADASYGTATGHLFDCAGSLQMVLRNFQIGFFNDANTPTTAIFLAQTNGTSNQIHLENVYVSGSYTVAAFYNYGVPSISATNCDFYNYRAGAGVHCVARWDAANAAALSSSFAAVAVGLKSNGECTFTACEFHKFAGAGANNAVIEIFGGGQMHFVGGNVSGGAAAYVGVHDTVWDLDFVGVYWGNEGEPVQPLNIVNVAAGGVLNNVTISGFAQSKNQLNYTGAEIGGAGTVNGVTLSGTMQTVTLASAATVNLGSTPAQCINVTGNTGITSFGSAPVGTVKFVHFAAALTLTHNAASLILPTAANITTVADDTLIAEATAAGWRVTFYQRATGAPVAPITTAMFAVNVVDTDGALTANSDTRLPSQKAVKTYVDQIVAANDAMVFKGVIDCSTNPNYPAADRGHTYRVSVAGKIGGAAGPNVEAGDILICTTDGTAAGDHATVGANWGVIQVNIDGAVTLTGVQTLTNKTLTAPVINSPTGIVKGDVGLGNVDNTSDATKNAAVATLTNKTLTDPLISRVIGGSAAGSTLTLQSTSGVGVGADAIVLKGGNNGATTWGTFNSTKLDLPQTTASTSVSTGALVVGGGVGIGGALFATGTGSFGGAGAMDAGYGPSLQTGGLFLITGTGPGFGLKKTNAPADQKYWDFFLGDTTFVLRAANDPFNAANNALQITRSGTTITGIDLLATSIGLGGSFIAGTCVAFPAGTAARSQMRLPVSAAPSAPVDGDLWREDNTNTGLKVRINGVTKTISVV